jgi:hypothetical protein
MAAQLVGSRAVLSSTELVSVGKVEPRDSGRSATLTGKRSATCGALCR